MSVRPVMFPPGRADWRSSPLADRIGDGCHDNRNRAGQFLIAATAGLRTTPKMKSILRRTRSARRSGNRSRLAFSDSATRWTRFLSLDITEVAQPLPQCFDVRRGIEETRRTEHQPVKFRRLLRLDHSPTHWNATARATIPTNFRFWILDFRLSEQKKAKRFEMTFICFSP